MSDFGAIADVGETLIELLKDRMKDLVDRESIVLASPAEIDSKNDVRLSLFLYQISEDVHLRNQEMQTTDPTKLSSPPLALELYYMLTSHVSSGESDKTDKILDEHRVLGRAMQVLYDHSILRGSFLKGNLGKEEELHITITPLSLDEMTKIWSTFQNKPFRTSVCYLVTPVRIDSERSMSMQRVVSKETDYTYIVLENGEK